MPTVKNIGLVNQGICGTENLKRQKETIQYNARDA